MYWHDILWPIFMNFQHTIISLISTFYTMTFWIKTFRHIYIYFYIYAFFQFKASIFRLTFLSHFSTYYTFWCLFWWNNSFNIILCLFNDFWRFFFDVYHYDFFIKMFNILHWLFLTFFFLRIILWLLYKIFQRTILTLSKCSTYYDFLHQIVSKYYAMTFSTYVYICAFQYLYYPTI